MVHRRASTEAVIIERQEQVDELCAQCRAEGRFAFDTEFVMEDRFQQEACLLQLATEETVALIDPFLDLDLRAVWELVGDPKVETVVHAGQEDLVMTSGVESMVGLDAMNPDTRATLFASHTLKSSLAWGKLACSL